MAPHSSTLAWKIPWMEEPGRLQSMGTRLRDFPFTFHFHALEKEMATHSSVLAWRIPGTGEPGGLPSMGSHRVGHDWSDLAVAAASIRWSSEVKVTQLLSLDSLRPHGLYNPWNSPGQNTGVGSLSLLQGIFLTQGSNPVLLHCRRFFTHWATRKAQEYWSGSPIPSPVDLPNPGIQLGSPSLQADSLPTELWRKPRWSIRRENDIILELILLLIKCIERFRYAKHPAKDHPKIISFDPQNNSMR